MGFNRSKYKAAVARYGRVWRATDKTLYGLCRRYPRHNDQAGVNAKLWIIGRTYATGIERKIPANGKQGGSMSQLARHLRSHARQVDALFARLREFKEPLRSARLCDIIDVHGRYMRLLQPVLRARQSPRSFASKYMHFHCPVVPIMDTFAERALRKAVRRQRSFQVLDLPPCADEHYARYVLRFWQLYSQAKAAGVRPTVRHLDYYLLGAAEDDA